MSWNTYTDDRTQQLDDLIASAPPDEADDETWWEWASSLPADVVDGVLDAVERGADIPGRVIRGVSEGAVTGFNDTIETAGAAAQGTIETAGGAVNEASGGVAWVLGLGLVAVAIAVSLGIVVI